MGFSRPEYWSGVPLPSPTTEKRFLENCIVPTSTGSKEVGWDVYESEGPPVLYVGVLV